MAAKVIFRQLFEKTSSTYTYIIGCGVTRQAVIIDPVRETADRDAKILKELELTPVMALNTHVHADHITGTTKLKKYFPQMKSALSKMSGGAADVYFDHGETINIGKQQLEVRATPGHTNGCVTFVDHNNARAFTGDALLIRACGRTDFQQGDSKVLYRSVWKEILSLPDEYALYVGHNYQGILQTSVWEEKKYNPRMTKTEEEFVKLMENLHLPYPAQIDKALPANLVDGAESEIPEEKEPTNKEARMDAPNGIK